MLRAQIATTVAGGVVAVCRSCIVAVRRCGIVAVCSVSVVGASAGHRIARYSRCAY